MALIVFRARVSVMAAMLSALCAPAATAADMSFFSPPPAPPVNGPVEFGSGWYLRGDIGYSNMAVPVVIADFVNNLGRTGAVSGGLGFGYQYNSWLRTDFTVDRAAFRPNTSAPAGWCPSGTVLDYPQGATTGPPNNTPLSGPMGYLYDPNEQCTASITNSIDRTTPMANVYLDLGNYGGFTPYVGAGIGMSYLQTSSTVSYIQNWNGQTWAPNLGQNGVPLGWITTSNVLVVNPRAPYPLAWQQLTPSESLTKRSWKFSWNLMAGVSYDVSQNLKIDAGYRFLNAGSYTSLPGLLTGASAATKNLYSQELRLGLRLVAN